MSKCYLRSCSRHKPLVLVLTLKWLFSDFQISRKLSVFETWHCLSKSLLQNPEMEIWIGLADTNLLPQIEALRTGDVVHCTNCKAHWGNVIVILSYINKMTWYKQAEKKRHKKKCYIFERRIFLLMTYNTTCNMAKLVHWTEPILRKQWAAEVRLPGTKSKPVHWSRALTGKLPTVHVFMLGKAKGNPRKHGENSQITHRKASLGFRKGSSPHRRPGRVYHFKLLPWLVMFHLFNTEHIWLRYFQSARQTHQRVVISYFY